MTYGLKCAFTCSRCRNGTPCHHENGTCLQGCDEGVYGGMCQNGKFNFIFVLPKKTQQNWSIFGRFINFFFHLSFAACISSVLPYTLSVTVWTSPTPSLPVLS